MGRNTKFTPETREKIYHAIDEGHKHWSAARMAGISETLLYRWLNAGKDVIAMLEDENNDIDYDSLDDKERDFHDFVVKFYETEAGWMGRQIASIEKSDPKWLLTRRFREDYGDNVNVDVNMGGKVQVEHSWKDFVEQAKAEGNDDD